MNLEQAKRVYPHRYTMGHVPAWAKNRPCDSGGTETRYYAPQYRSDQEWFENTLFPPNNPFHKSDCYSSNPTWPLGKWLDKPFERQL